MRHALQNHGEIIPVINSTDKRSSGRNNCSPSVSEQGVVDRFIDPRSGPEWDDMVGRHQSYSPFHGSSWARVLSRTYGHVPFYIHLSQGGDLVSLVPMMEVSSRLTGRRGICLPFTDFCKPLGFDRKSNEEVFSAIVRLARVRMWKYIEIRGEVSPADRQPSATFYGHVLGLRGDSTRVLKSFSSATRGAVGRAKSSCLQFQVDRTWQGMRDFYQLHIRARRRHGLPPQPEAFFRTIHSEMIENGSGFVGIARHGLVPAAAAVFLMVGKTALYKFAASDHRLQEYRGNNLVMWESIRYLVDAGIESLHLGRTALDNEGLRRFKLGWGTDEELIRYFKFDLATNTWLSERDLTRGLHNQIFSRLPVILNRLAGTLLYPHLD